VIIILSAAVVFAVRGTGDKGKASAVKIDKRTLETAQEAFCAKFGTYGTEDQLAGIATAPDGSTSMSVSTMATTSSSAEWAPTSSRATSAARMPSAKPAHMSPFAAA